MKQIRTDGYRGPLTNGRYVPPGEYLVGDVEGLFDLAARMLDHKLAGYMLDIGKAQITVVATDMMPDSTIAMVAPGGDVVVLGNIVPEIEPHVFMAFESYDDMKKTELIAEAESRGLDTSGTKADLVARLEADDGI